MKRLIGKLMCWAGFHDWRETSDAGALYCTRGECSVRIKPWLWLCAAGIRSAARWRSVALLILTASVALLLLWAGTALGSTQPAQVVEDAALRHGIPPALHDALHNKECSRRVICPRGLHGEWGPFQVRVVTAIEAGCATYRWWIMPGNADCAARVLILKGAKPGRYRRALARYNGCSLPCWKGNWYGDEVYNAWLRAELAAAQAQLLAQK